MAESLGVNKALSKEQFIRAFDAAYDELLAAAVATVERGIVLQEGEWGPREVLAHIAGWAAEATVRIPQVIAGSPPVVYTDDTQHGAINDAFNAAAIIIAGNQSFDQVSAIMQQTHQRFVHMLQAQDDSIFVPGNYVYERVLAVVRHHLQHTQELEKRGMM
jgi:hypothetical protein